MHQFLKRERFLKNIHDNLRRYPICALLGPRQVGKTTLAEYYADTYFPGKAHFIDLEKPEDLARLQNPMLTLSKIEEPLIVIDEIQRRPDLFPILRVLADQTRGLGREGTKKRSFLILGSASRNLLKQSSESLTGRIGYLELTPFSLFEVKDSDRLWMRGGFPQAYLAENERDSYIFRQGYIRTFLEQDVPNLGFRIPPDVLRRFWNMLAFYHGQTFNGTQIAHSLMLTGKTVRSYLDILVSTFMIRSLTPWKENINKRQVSSPKVYFRDSGILNALVGIPDKNALQVFPGLGAHWEGFVIEEIIRVFQATPDECFFWATHGDAELDLLIVKDGKRIGFEVKYTDFPRTTKSMHSALKDLRLDSLGIVYPGTAIFQLTDKITAYGLETIVTGEFQKQFGIATEFERSDKRL